MPAPEQSEKTEPATDKRREESRKRGEVAQSREVQTVILLGTAVALLGSGFAFDLFEGLASVMTASWTAERPRELGDFHALFLRSLATVGLGLVPIMCLLAVSGVGSAVVQIGPLFSLEALSPRASRLSLTKGFKRMVDLDRLFDLGKALFKVAIVGLISWVAIERDLDQIIATCALPLRDSLEFAGELTRGIALTSLAFLGVMAALDLVYQRARFEKRLQMTKKEVRDEAKDRDGNPHVRSRARALQREMSRSRMIASVAEASVVVTNPTHYAVALQYRPELTAPLVLAKGRNHVARRIREVARENDVPLVENKVLARMLHRTAKVGAPIPAALYKAVAEVLAYVYRLDPSRASSWGAAR